MPTETDKQQAIEAIQSLPDTATIDEAKERLCFIASVEEGLRQSRDGEYSDPSRAAGRLSRVAGFGHIAARRLAANGSLRTRVVSHYLKITACGLRHEAATCPGSSESFL